MFLDDNIEVTVDEIVFGFNVWNHFQDSIIGFRTSDYVYNVKNGQLQMSNAKSSEFSMVSMSSAWINRFYLDYFNKKSTEMIRLVNTNGYNDCSSIALNMAVSEVTRLGPIALTPKFYKETVDDQQEIERSNCLNRLVEIFHGNYLAKSTFRNKLII